jgi:glycosyltransferase involved in cell wall biosynthesis
MDGLNKINLSYIIATRNRLPFLKITLEKLLAAVQPDEQIVVVDGLSTDGSREYLQELFKAGSIHQYISESDKNQAHAWNKALLMAKGTIIKKIIDDDIFCYDAIRKCKNHMLQHDDVDVVISNDLGCSVKNYKEVQKSSRLPQFEKWRSGATPTFTFGDVHMLIRRSALANIGLYNTSFIMMDWEYSLRISQSKANICYYTGYNALSVSHPESVSSLKNTQLITAQGKKAAIFYGYAGDASEISLWSKIKIFIGKRIYKDKAELDNRENINPKDLPVIYNYLYCVISDLNGTEEGIFIEGRTNSID